MTVQHAWARFRDMRTTLHMSSLFACMQMGCKECVWDTYWADLKAYDREVALREGKAPPLDPFEELERRLAATNGGGG